MHEGNFTQEIVSAILKELDNHKGAKPRRVTVSVGEMLHLEPESVRLYFEMLTKGTILDGVELALHEVHAEVKCSVCKKTGQLEDHHLLMCPHCQATSVQLIKGQDVVIEAIEI